MLSRFARVTPSQEARNLFCGVDMRDDVSQILTMAVPKEMMREGDGWRLRSLRRGKRYSMMCDDDDVASMHTYKKKCPLRREST